MLKEVVENTKEVESAKETVEKIYKFLKNERPLFFHDFVKALNGYLKSNPVINTKDLFNSSIKKIFKLFRKSKRKADCNWEFNYSSLLLGF